MEYRRWQASHSKYPCPLSALEPLYQLTREITLRILSIFLLEHITVMSYFPCVELPTDPAMRFCRGSLSHARTLEGRAHQAVSVGHRGGHERP